MTPRYRMGVGRARFKPQWNQPVARNEEPIELTLVLHDDTAKAWLVSSDGERDKAVWLAKSLVEQGRQVGEEIERVSGVACFRRTIHEFLVPEWLANERGLL